MCGNHRNTQHMKRCELWAFKGPINREQTHRRRKTEIKKKKEKDKQEDLLTLHVLPSENEDISLLITDPALSCRLY